MTIPAERLQQIVNRFAELEARMASGTLEGEEFVQASRDYAELEPVAKLAREVSEARDEIDSLTEMLADPEMKAMAEEELANLRESLPEKERALAIAMLPRDSADAKPAMLEIRAGTGGDEAGLFAGDLYRMYEKFAAEQGWKVEPVSMSASEVGGFKEVVAEIAGTGVFAKLKFESGVHRVQRVPVTESGGRIHASAATVADFLQTWETGELKGDSCYNAGVDLPNGSLITQLRVFYSNGGGDSPILRLVATKIGTGVSTFLVDVALPDTGNARVSKAYETGHKVNTKKYLYGIGFCPFNDGAFFGVRIKYKPG